MPETVGQGRAVAYLNKAGIGNARIRVGGHSKGGNLAVYASVFCDQAVQDKILNVYSNDGPGFSTNFVEGTAYKRMLPRIVSIVPDSSIIGMLLHSKSVPLVLKSSARSIFQHDAFTWQLHRNQFEQAGLSEISLLTNQILDDWIEQMSEEERHLLTDTVFSLFESTGKDRFSEMSAQKWKSFESITSTLYRIPKHKQKEMVRLIGLLGKTGGQTVTDYLKTISSKWTAKQQAEFNKLAGEVIRKTE